MTAGPLLGLVVIVLIVGGLTIARLIELDRAREAEAEAEWQALLDQAGRDR